MTEYTIIQFSPTGNASYIAHRIAMNLGNTNEPLALEHTDPLQLAKGEHLILVFAVHAFNAPKTVKRFVRNLPEGFYKHVSLVGVGCNTIWVNDAVTRDVRRMLESKSYDIVADRVIAMPLTFIMSFPEEIIQNQLIQAQQDVKDISEQIRVLERNRRDIAFRTNIVNFVGRAEPVASRFFGLELHANKSCTKCGLCMRECPEKNIRMTVQGKMKFGFKCIMCMRCIYNCPEKAVSPRFSKFIPISKGYKLENHLNQSRAEQKM